MTMNFFSSGGGTGAVTGTGAGALAAKSKVICDNVLPITLYKGTDDAKPNTCCYRTVEKLNLAFIAEIGPLLLVKALIRSCCPFQDSIELFRTEVIIEEINRINLTSILMYFIMQVR